MHRFASFGTFIKRCMRRKKKHTHAHTPLLARKKVILSQLFFCSRAFAELSPGTAYIPVQGTGSLVRVVEKTSAL